MMASKTEMKNGKNCIKLEKMHYLEAFPSLGTKMRHAALIFRENKHKNLQSVGTGGSAGGISFWTYFTSSQVAFSNSLTTQIFEYSSLSSLANGLSVSLVPNNTRANSSFASVKI